MKGLELEMTTSEAARWWDGKRLVAPLVPVGAWGGGSGC